MKKILLSLILIGLCPIYVFAQTDTPLYELTAQSSEVKAAEIDELNQKEDERTQQIANLLGFTLPEYTDNPSYVITFKDPSSDSKGVEISLDSKPYEIIKSPYTFPALGIGIHEVKFRFYDQTDTIKILEYQLIVIPRAPIINSPIIEEASILLSGTALPNAEVIFTLSANTYTNINTVNADSNGEWSVQITSDQGLVDGIYTFTAYARKYGYSSNLASPITFVIGDSATPVVDETKKDIYFAFKDITKENIIDIFKKNIDLTIFSASLFFLGVFVTCILKGVVDSSKDEKKYKEVQKIIAKNTPDDKKEGKTLRELFGGPEKEEESSKKEVVVPPKEEIIINRDIFLKRFKSMDPDNASGKEVKTKVSKKKVKVSLTSKKE